jgi:uncharacterized protein involved in exopolysaccharide biosynthesis
VQEVRQQAREARKILEREEASRSQTKTTPNRAFEELHLARLKLRSQAAMLAAKAGTLRGQLADARAGLKSLNEDEMRLNQAERRVAIQDAQYRAYAQGQEQARIDQALELARISNISVVQPATLEVRPVSPRKMQTALLAMIAAVAGGVGLALFAESQDRSFQTLEDVEEHLGLPALAAIPRWRAGWVGSSLVAGLSDAHQPVNGEGNRP